MSELLSDVSHIVYHCLPNELQQQSLPYGTCPVDWQTTYQYPRHRPDAPSLCIHQVALRSTGLSDDNDDDMHALFATEIGATSLTRRQRFDHTLLVVAPRSSVRR